MESLLAKNKVFKTNVRQAEKVAEEINGGVGAIAVHRKRVELMVDEIDKLLTNICIEAKKEEQYNSNEAELGKINNTNPKISTPRDGQRDSDEMKHKGNSEVRLPILQLPVFNGNLQEWVTFKDLYEAVLQYLKGLLKGEAAAVLNSIPISSANYSEAWAMSVDSTLKQLFSQPAVHYENVVMLCKLLDNVVECTRLLKVLGQPMEHWDSIFVFLTVAAVTNIRRIADMCTVDTILEHCTRALAAAGFVKSKTPTQVPLSRHSTGKLPCYIMILRCKGEHTLHKCPEFASVSVEERHAFLKDCRLCFNCLGAGHAIRQCRFSRCRLSHQYHHILLHCGDNTEHHPQDRVETEVNNHHARPHGSSEHQANVGEWPSYTVKALVLPNLTGLLPKEPIKPKNNWMHSEGTPGHIDVLLGADIYSFLLRPGHCTRTEGSSVAIETVFGWVLSGPTDTSKKKSEATVLHLQLNVDKSLQRFWELEDK
ncbi:hypothetical protein PR048_021565 [Dryococelus australis]|uniref:Peptidase aspartic putative domain-containing protein n=1 Tax=Dryococelus australis TaxID=614101 RepID=A0ABQ9GYL3_9NEOP|nr:hypothetical protein PR048_021565 [Dryococelus australis]